jgi:plasmid stability protein
VPHSFVDPTSVARVGLALVTKDLVLGATCNRDYEADFGGGKGASVNVRVPAALAARERTLAENGAITMDDVVEGTVAVALASHIYSAVRVNDADLTLSVEDFARQILDPQVLAIVERVEDKVAAAMSALPVATGIAYTTADPAAAFTAARKRLRDLGIPSQGLYAAVGTAIYADLLNAKAITDASQSGTTEALREAIVGKVRGFDIIESNRIGEKDIVFYSKAAFTLAVRAPKVPEGASFGQSMAEGGFAMRWVKDYDASTLADRSVVSTFIGVQAMTVATTAKAQDGSVVRVTPALRIVAA